ncbi:MAG: sialidase family protein, partial [Candidatus Hadarchaeales archaeon]
VASGNAVYLAWEEVWWESETRYHSPPYVLFYKYSIDAGQTWSDAVQVETDISFETGSPSLVIGKDKLRIIYGSNEVAVNNWELYSVNSTDAGSSWGNKTRLTNDQSGDSRFPVAAGTGATVHVVWWDDRDDLTKDRRGYPPLEPTGNYEIYYKRSTDGGATWGSDTRLTSDSGISRDPTIATAGQDVYVVWADNRDGNYEIYFKQSNDGGATWSEDVRLTNNSRRSYYPSVAVDGAGNVHVVWWDDRDGNKEIYYKKGTVGT